MYKISDNTRDNTIIIPITEKYEPIKIILKSDNTKVIFEPEEISIKGIDVNIDNTYNDKLLYPDKKIYGNTVVKADYWVCSGISSQANPSPSVLNPSPITPYISAGTYKMTHGGKTYEIQLPDMHGFACDDTAYKDTLTVDFLRGKYELHKKAGSYAMPTNVNFNGEGNWNNGIKRVVFGASPPKKYGEKTIGYCAYAQVMGTWGSAAGHIYPNKSFNGLYWFPDTVELGISDGATFSDGNSRLHEVLGGLSKAERTVIYALSSETVTSGNITEVESSTAPELPLTEMDWTEPSMDYPGLITPSGDIAVTSGNAVKLPPMYRTKSTTQGNVIIDNQAYISDYVTLRKVDNTVRVILMHHTNKYTMTGEETIGTNDTFGYYFNTNVLPHSMLVGRSLDGICSHLKTIFAQGQGVIFGKNNPAVYFSGTGFSTPEEFKSCLAAQYAAGTPVEIVYTVATPWEEDITDTPEGQSILAARTKPLHTHIYSPSDVKPYLDISILRFQDQWLDDILGLQVDYANRKFERLEGAVGKTAGSDFDKYKMYGGRRRCNVSDDGTIVAYYGDDNYTEDGSNGQVMVYQPAFYYKVVPLVYNLNTQSNIGYHLHKANYYISAKPKTGFKLHPAFYNENGNPVDYILMSAYEGSMYDVSTQSYVDDSIVKTNYEDGDLLCSISGKKPISSVNPSLTISKFELMSNNRGEGWHLETIKSISANQLLMIIEFGIMNMQIGIGYGIVNGDVYIGNINSSCLTGSTAALGNTTGQAISTICSVKGIEKIYTEEGKVSITYRGVENPWGNIGKLMNGINIYGDGTMGGGQPYIANNFAFNYSNNFDNYEETGFTLPNKNNDYIKAMGYGKEKFDWLFIPSEATSSISSSIVGDCSYILPNNNNNNRLSIYGGNSNISSCGGAFYYNFYYPITYTRGFVGGRLMYVPK